MIGQLKASPALQLERERGAGINKMQLGGGRAAGARFARAQLDRFHQTCLVADRRGACALWEGVDPFYRNFGDSF